MSSDTEGSFNREPFFLGAYDQIAHYRGGRYGRSSNFLLGLNLTEEETNTFTRKGVRRALNDGYSRRQLQITNFRINLTFSNQQSQPILDRVVIENRYVSFLLSRSLLPSFDVMLLDGNNAETIVQEEQSNLFTAVPSALNRNSVAPFLLPIQSWIYADLFDCRKKKRTKIEENLLTHVTKALLPANLFSEHSVYASAPFRTKPERTYSPVEASSSAEGSHIPILLAQAKAFERHKWSRIKTSLEEFGKQSGLFKKIDIKRLGNATSDPFQIIISVSQDRSNIIDVGYGVSQILPIIVETMINDNAEFFIFQQPEVHLRPRAQAELGSYFAKYALDNDKYLVLETHSDYIIDRVKSDLIRSERDINQALSVLFFERNNLETVITRIKFDEKGNVLNPPKNYRNFFLAESIRTLGI